MDLRHLGSDVHRGRRIYPNCSFFLHGGYRAVIWAAMISLAAHFAVGAAKSLLTIRSWWSSGSEMTFVGAVEGLVTFLIGMALGRIGGGIV
jgi:VIT1/CCC1 family predicted Fe2+/Mn2+ transporter